MHTFDIFDVKLYKLLLGMAAEFLWLFFYVRYF